MCPILLRGNSSVPALHPSQINYFKIDEHETLLTGVILKLFPNTGASVDSHNSTADQETIKEELKRSQKRAPRPVKKLLTDMDEVTGIAAIRLSLHFINELLIGNIGLPQFINELLIERRMSSSDCMSQWQTALLVLTAVKGRQDFSSALWELRKKEQERRAAKPTPAMYAIPIHLFDNSLKSERET
ncbi:unnamed protein product [Timema podura]|uniref:Uncharacterized protein n=1 Tax=Timema podura TaxID=61482 RepID=A0ABN7PJA8_TIMPD|nr:unnamed protein product [Timema podura]